MSRIGKKIITIPSNVQVTVQDNVLKAKGPKGELSVKLPEEIAYKIENSELTFSRESDQKDVRAKHGLSRALAFNTISGVSNGFSKLLRITGVGYKAEMKNNHLLMSLGFSHQILLKAPAGVTFEVQNPTTVVVNGIDKQIVGEVASKIRSLRPPEPYKGKGIRYDNEYVRRKAGKTSSK